VRRFAPLRRIVEQVVYGPEPVGAAGAAVLERYAHGQLDGGPLGGLAHFGMTGEACNTWSGWTASPQTFQGQAQIGSVLNPPIIQEPALPGAQSPAALATWVEEMETLGYGIPQ
jgi:hypothetical protein